MAIDLPKITELVSGGPRILTQMGPAAKPRLIKNIILTETSLTQWMEHWSAD